MAPRWTKDLVMNIAPGAHAKLMELASTYTKSCQDSETWIG